MAKKTEFTASGIGDEFVVVNRSSCRYFADFANPGGVGTVQLEMKIGEDWLPAAESITASMATVATADAPSSEQTAYRWNCTVYTSGTIVGYLG